MELALFVCIDLCVDFYDDFQVKENNKQVSAGDFDQSCSLYIATSKLKNSLVPHCLVYYASSEQNR